MTADSSYRRTNLLTTSTEDTSIGQRTQTRSSATAFTFFKSDLQRRISKRNNTSLSGESTAEAEGIGPPIDRIYPQMFDAEAPAGQSLTFIHNAFNDAQSALEAFSSPDLQTVASRLTQIASTMARIHPLTEFNESFGAVVSFIRRATLIASPLEVSRPGLNSLVQVLRSLYSNPMMDLDEASDLVDELKSSGWHGEHGVAETLIAELLNESDDEPEEVQVPLFP